jgi:hypothetical protein
MNGRDEPEFRGDSEAGSGVAVRPQDNDDADGDRERRAARASPSGPRKSDPVGLRTRRRQLEAERRLKTESIAAGTVIALLVIVALGFWMLRAGIQSPDKGQGFSPGTDRTLLVAYAPGGVSEGAESIVLFGLLGDDRGSALLVPAGTTTDVPVHGPGSLGEALAFGGPELLELATENLLGVRVDGTITVDRQGFIDAIAPLAPFEVLVEERLGTRDGDNIVTKFQPGLYQMDAPTLNAYLEFRGEGESEVARLARRQKVWEAVFERARAIPDKGLSFTAVDGSHLRSNTPISSVDEMLSQLRFRDVAFTLLPVDPKQSLEGVESFEPIQGEIQRVVTQRFPGAAVAPDVEARLRIGILNGNGGVGVSEEVAKRLIPHGYRVVYTENADRFDYAETQIIFYRTPDERVAREIRSTLGVGRLVLNHQMQDVVDILIVVGRDYPVGRVAAPAEGQAGG